jgi:4-hydroxybenzoate polyprenyltransferase
VIGLYWRMLRYRVAAMVWMFMLLGAAFPNGLPDFSPAYVWVTVALASSYVAATSVNDIADADIDRVNHPQDAGRPLVTGAARPRDLWLLHCVASLAALAAGGALGLRALALAVCSLLIGIAYSLRPIRLSYRTYLAPLALGVAYVAVPYLLGAVATGRDVHRRDAVLLAALYVLFVARIVLKDFRDRAGDALYDKPTLLLRFGKDGVCGASLAALVAGNALLLAALRPAAGLALLLELFVLAIAFMLRQLRVARDGHSEQVAIGIGARLGNGLLITVLAWLVLRGEGAPPGTALAFAAALTTLFGLGCAVLVARPDEAVIGYKG